MVDRLAEWTVPITWQAATALEEDTLNEQVRNNSLFLKATPLAIVLSRTQGSNPSTSSGTYALVSSFFTLNFTLPYESRVILGATVPVQNSSNPGRSEFDWFDGVNYVASGAPTSTVKSYAVQSDLAAGVPYTVTMLTHLGVLAAASYTYELHWRVTTGTVTIPAMTQPVSLFAWGL